MYEDWLEKAHAYFQEASNKDLTLTLASEWVLDNYYIIRQALRQIGEDLPAGYYKQLPKLAGGPLKGLPRIYAIGRGCAFLPKLFIECDGPSSHPDPGSGTCTPDYGRIMGFTDFPALQPDRNPGAYTRMVNPSPTCT